MKSLLSRCTGWRTIGLLDRGAAGRPERRGGRPLGPPGDRPRHPAVRRRAAGGGPRADARTLAAEPDGTGDARLRQGRGRSRAVGPGRPARVAGLPGSRADHRREPLGAAPGVLPGGRAGDQPPGRGTDHRPDQARAQQAAAGLPGGLPPARDPGPDGDARGPGHASRADRARARPGSSARARHGSGHPAARGSASGSSSAGRRPSACWRRRHSRCSGTPSTSPRRTRRPRSWPPTRRSGCRGGTAGSSLPIDTVIVHGRPDLELTIKPEAFRERTGAACSAATGPDHEPAAAALGMALANPAAPRPRGSTWPAASSPPSRSGRSSPGASWSSRGRSWPASRCSSTAPPSSSRAGSSRPGSSWRTFSWLKDQDQAKLEKEKKLLEERSGRSRRFRAVAWTGRPSSAPSPPTCPSRPWSPRSRGSARASPAGKSAAGSKNQMVVSFATPMADDGAMPREINEFIAALRVEPALQTALPRSSRSPACGPTRPSAIAARSPRTASSACPRPIPRAMVQEPAASK